MPNSRGFLPLQQCFRISPPERCRSLSSARWNVSHSFSTSARTCEVAPESPKFIHIPQPLQPSYPPKRIVKGILPVPREIFRPQDPDKTSPDYLAAVTPEPSGPSADASTSSSPPSELADRLAWRRRLASSRRRLLRESLFELRRRKDRTDKAIAARKAIRRAEREQALNQPQREDDRLTSPTVIQAMKQFQVGILPDPDREARIAAKAAHVQAIQEQIKEKRKDLLHTLYMNARLFITTESHLDDEINRVFTSWPKEWHSDAYKGRNIWNRGPPKTVQEMIHERSKKGRSAMKQITEASRQTQDRMKRIAEELTGGKL